MMSGRLRVVLAIGVLSIVPVRGYAQEAVVSGTVTDTTGGVLPGVTVTAANEASGNTFKAVTDERGKYRMPTRIGSYRVTAELAGFTSVTRTAWSCRWVSRRSSTCRWRRRASQETVTVTGEAPLIETTVDSRRQHRPAADAGAAAQRPELDGSDAAGARQPRATQRGEIAACTGRRACSRSTWTASR